MNGLLPQMPLLIAFLVASFVLAVTPGPGVFYVVTRSLAQGRRAGLASVAGVALGNFCNAVGAAVGLAALFAVSSMAFSIVKYAGALYLIYLGVKALRAPQNELDALAPPAVAARRLFRDGLIVAALNPKTAVFFAAFLPQFIGPTATLGQSVLLGSIFVAMAALTDSLYALAASSIAPLFARRRNWQRSTRYVLGGSFIGLGVLTAVSGNLKAR